MTGTDARGAADTRRAIDDLRAAERALMQPPYQHDTWAWPPSKPARRPLMIARLAAFGVAFLIAGILAAMVTAKTIPQAVHDASMAAERAQ